MTETIVTVHTEPVADNEPELDEELLAEAQRGLGTPSRNATLNAALHEYVERKRAERRALLQDLRKMSDDGLFNYEALDEAER